MSLFNPKPGSKHDIALAIIFAIVGLASVASSLFVIAVTVWLLIEYQLATYTIGALALASPFVLLLRLRQLLRIGSPYSYKLHTVCVTKDFYLWPSFGCEYGYQEGHELHKGFCIEWLWFYFAFQRLK